ncbi:hypothetical protein ACFLU6_07520 [Acidobacteriota bacterium]
MNIPKSKQTCQHSFFELREDSERPGKQKPVWECHHSDKEIRSSYGIKQDGCQECPEWSSRV